MFRALALRYRETLFAFIHSQLAYGIEICDNTYPTHLNKLAVLNKILQILQCAARDSHDFC